MTPARLASGSYLGHSGKHMLAASLSQADPMRSFPRLNRHSKPDIRPGGQSALAEVGRLRFRFPMTPAASNASHTVMNTSREIIGRSNDQRCARNRLARLQVFPLIP
jgi:hypothetical protein